MDVSDIPDPSRTWSFSFYIVLLFLVGPLWTCLPLVWFCLLYNVFQPELSILGIAISAICLVEVLFSIYHFYLKRRISDSPPSPCSQGNLGEIQTAFERILKSGLAEQYVDVESLEIKRPSSPNEVIIQLDEADPRAVDFRNTLRTSFGRVPWSQVCMHEVQQWIYWSIFGTALPAAHSIPRSHIEVMDRTVDLLQKRLGRIIPQGSSDGKVKPSLLTIDPVNVSWRPFCYYLVIAGLNWLVKQWLQLIRGMRFDSRDGLDYLLKVPDSWDPVRGPSPVVVIHGLGLGLLQYVVLINDLLISLPDRPILIPLQPHISQDIFHARFLKPMTRHETTRCLIKLMLELKWIEDEADILEKDASLSTIPRTFKPVGPGVTMLSHSNGSYCHAWMLKGYSNLVHRSCFVDPVAFGSWEGDVCYNFIYKRCTTGMELLMRYFVGTEIGVANLLQRHFDWASNTLWFEEIPDARNTSKTLFCLGGMDEILCAQRIKKYLTSHGVHENLILDPVARHGHALVVGTPAYSKIIQWLKG